MVDPNALEAFVERRASSSLAIRTIKCRCGVMVATPD